MQANAKGQGSQKVLTPLIAIHTNKSMEKTLADLKMAIANNNYVYVREQNVDSKLTKIAYENNRVIYVYFCNFNMVSKALKMDSRVGVFLPCVITLIQREKGVDLVAVNPRVISKKLNDSRLTEICNKLTGDYLKILDEAAI